MSANGHNDRVCQRRDGYDCEFPGCDCPLQASMGEVRIGLRAEVEGLAFVCADQVRVALAEQRPEAAGCYASTLRELCGALECLPLEELEPDTEEDD